MSEAMMVDHAAVNGQEEAAEFDLWSVGAALVRNRWRIVAWTFLGGLVAALMVFNRPLVYTSNTSFMVRGAATSTGGGFADLAGRIGLSLPAADVSQSPDFYLALLNSRALLLPVVEGSVEVDEPGVQSRPFLDVFAIEGRSGLERTENGVAELRSMISPSVDRTTGILALSVTTRAPVTSLSLVTSLLEGVNDFNQRLRRTQARAEREFVEQRMQLAAEELREAEDAVARFLEGNREFGGSPVLTFNYERLQRIVARRQQVHTSLAQAYEEARIQEVRDIPLITAIDPPVLPTRPASRGRLKAGLLGLLTGGFVGGIVAVIRETTRRQQRTGNRGTEELRLALREARDEARSWIGGRRSKLPG